MLVKHSWRSKHSFFIGLDGTNASQSSSKWSKNLGNTKINLLQVHKTHANWMDKFQRKLQFPWNCEELINCSRSWTETTILLLKLRFVNQLVPPCQHSCQIGLCFLKEPEALFLNSKWHWRGVLPAPESSRSLLRLKAKFPPPPAPCSCGTF